MNTLTIPKIFVEPEPRCFDLHDYRMITYSSFANVKIQRMKKLLEIEWYVLMRPLINIQKITDVSCSNLKKFFNEHFNSPKAFKKTKSEIF